MTDQLVITIIGTVLAFLNAACLTGLVWMHKAIVVLIQEVATLKAIASMFDREEQSRQRHRINQIEISQERIEGEINGIKERCRLFHNTENNR